MNACFDNPVAHTASAPPQRNDSKYSIPFILLIIHTRTGDQFATGFDLVQNHVNKGQKTLKMSSDSSRVRWGIKEDKRE
ncbi:hypothetical protein VTN49DRAFT_2587 [Thermomyces lanuginosus]|uniref:uncharacterized protein n=1 Tax=Thermomyces lanuginosus TaxID=5541 RepID=UPI0037439464